MIRIRTRMFMVPNCCDAFLIRAKRVSNCYIQEKKKLTVCVSVCVDVRLMLVLVWKKCLGFSVGYVLCASPYSSTTIMW